MTVQEKLKFIIQNWEKMSSKELAEKLKIPKGSISIYATKIRKNGIDLPRRSGSGRPKQIINWEELKQYEKNTKQSKE